MILEPLVDHAVLSKFTMQELRTAWHCRLLALVCPWRDTQGGALKPSSSPTLGSVVGICQVVHLHKECEILMANTRTKGHGASSHRILELQPAAGKPEKSTWERTCRPRALRWPWCSYQRCCEGAKGRGRAQAPLLQARAVSGIRL